MSAPIPADPAVLDAAVAIDLPAEVPDGWALVPGDLLDLAMDRTLRGWSGTEHERITAWRAWWATRPMPAVGWARTYGTPAIRSLARHLTLEPVR